MSKTREMQSQEGALFLNTFAKAPKIAIVLGSGLSTFATALEEAITISYSDIPHFSPSSVKGHAGTLVIGKLNGISIVAMCGRTHLYEGYTATQVVQPVRTLAEWGIKHLIITNAAGALDTSFSPGALMLITDQINGTGQNPLVGKPYGEGKRFVDMTQSYDLTFQNLILKAAKEESIPLEQGVYLGLLGPNYETPAEIKMFQKWGASAVGMSTVLEVLAARQLNMRVAGISCITNLGAGLQDTPLHHDEVKDTANQVQDIFKRLLSNSIQKIHSSI